MGKGPEAGESGAWVKGGPEFGVPVHQGEAEALEESGKAVGWGRAGGCLLLGWEDEPLS